ncbi:C-GCAxxG-C-C family protein [Desulforhopalus sp. IMCC35007]|uniref:C-GCAxxG-C-C family protein n=1 Tax=Desulforhopalus sp. IMCC35007 TaxID=2569543 RepID=UPI0010ADF2AC|nr:C-GCAxxG-C-C family protein [Desulforhopalus sp. IMCC35007]TKB07487.1 C_GCAxxG_C_C family protein [Desulforhopalus sp. IMCC35007]
MNDPELVKNRVAQYYWEDDLNCATTTLKILSERFNIEVSDQVFSAATGMHGAGLYGAQCGLVEGTLMFLGIFSQQNNYSKDQTVRCCYEFANAFENVFGSLQCRVLRPEGFTETNPPHLCESLTCRAVDFAILFIQNIERTHQRTKSVERT